MIRHSTYRTFGVYGRPPDYGPVKAISFVAWNHLIGKREPEAIHKINHFMEVGRRNNLTSADVIVDVQASRKLAPADVKGRLRVVEERRNGIVVTGAKAGSSVLAQGNIGTISMPPPAGTLPEECMIWAAIPANAPGLKLLLREAVLTGTENAEDHPLDIDGEEADGILLFFRLRLIELLVNPLGECVHLLVQLGDLLFDRQRLLLVFLVFFRLHFLVVGPAEAAESQQAECGQQNTHENTSNG